MRVGALLVLAALATTGCVSTCWLQDGKTAHEGRFDWGASFSNAVHRDLGIGGSLDFRGAWGLADWLEAGAAIGGFVPPLVSGGMQLRAGILSEERMHPVSAAVGVAGIYGQYQKPGDEDDFVAVTDLSCPKLTLSRDLGSLATLFGSISLVRREEEGETPAGFRTLLGYGAGGIVWILNHRGEGGMGRFGVAMEYQWRTRSRLQWVEQQVALGVIFRQ